MSEEEIRLIKGYFNDGYCCDLDELKEIANKMIDQLQQKGNIIKEVREKLNTQLAFTSSYQLNYQSAMSIIEEAKSILDKENKE